MPSSSISMTFYYRVYLQQYGKYLDVNLIGSKASNQKQEQFSCLSGELNPGLNNHPMPNLKIRKIIVLG